MSQSKVLAPQVCFSCWNHIAPRGTGTYPAQAWEAQSPIAILVCSCGGVGVTFPTDDFRERAAKIWDLRHRISTRGPLPDPVISQTLPLVKEIQQAMTAMHENYGGGVGCFAKDVANGRLGDAIRAMEKLLEEDKETARKLTLSADPEQAQIGRGIHFALQRKLEKATGAFLALANDFSTGTAAHCCGNFFFLFQRDLASAERWYREAVSRVPGSAAHRLQLASFLSRVGEYAESEAEIHRAKECADADKVLSQMKKIVVGPTTTLQELFERAKAQASATDDRGSDSGGKGSGGFKN